MSKLLVNTIVISCLLFASSAFSAGNTSLSETIASAEHQTYLSEYKSYPQARRSDLTLHMMEIVSEHY